MTELIKPPSSSLSRNQDLDQFYENSIRLQNKIDQSNTTTQKECERVDNLINDVNNNTLNSKTSNISLSTTSSKRKREIFKRTCKCQYGKKCKCGDNCQCSHEIQTELQTQFDNENGSINKNSKRSTWYIPWGHGKVKAKVKKNKSKEMITKDNEKRTILKDELSPNSMKDKEMIEIFSDNEAHSIQDKLVFPNSPIVSSDNDIINNDKDNLIFQKDKNKSDVILSEQQRRESIVSSDDYSMIKLQNYQKFNELKGKDLKCTCPDKKELKEVTKISNDKELKCTCPTKDKEKKRFFDKIWDKFRSKSIKEEDTIIENKDKGEMDPIKVGSSKDMIDNNDNNSGNVILTPDERETNVSIKGQFNNNSDDIKFVDESYYNELNRQTRSHSF